MTVGGRQQVQKAVGALFVVGCKMRLVNAAVVRGNVQQLVVVELYPHLFRQALSYLAEKEFELLEESYNDVLFLDNYRGGENTEGIVPVTEENFPLFAELHSQFDSDMYWNSERLRQSLDQWMLFLYEKENVLKGAIYCTKGELAEIFGVDYADGVYSPEIFCALTGAVLNDCKARQV